MATDKYKKVGKMSDVGTLNESEQGMRKESLAGLQNLQDNYKNILASMTGDQMKGLLGNIGTAAGGYGAIGQGITDAAAKFGQIDMSGLNAARDAYDPTAANKMLMSSMPGYIDMSQYAASSALSPTSQSATELARLATNDAMRASSAQLAAAGLLGSGAGNQSLFEAALTPQQQLQTDLAKMQSDYSGNVLGGLLNSGTQMFGQGYETQNANTMGVAQQGVNNQLTAADYGFRGATSQLDVANSDVQAQQGVYNSYMNNLMSQLQGTQARGADLSNLAQLTQQQYYTPQYAKKTSWLDYAGAAAGIAGGVGGMMTGLGALGGLGKAAGGLAGLGSAMGGGAAMMNAFGNQGNAAGGYDYMPQQQNTSSMFNMQNPWGGGQNNFNAGVMSQFPQSQQAPGHDPMNYYGNQWGLQNQPVNFGQSIYPSAYSR